MNAQSTALAERNSAPPLVKLNQQLEQRADEFRKVLPSHIKPEQLQRTIMTAAQSNPDLLSADRQSFILASMKAAQDGLLPDGREAAFVVFNNSVRDGNNWVQVQTVQYMPMVYGLRKKIMQSGEISNLQTGVVYRAEVEAGAFIYEIGLEQPIRHRPLLDISDEDASDDNIVAAYSIARMKDGTVSVELMRRSEINKVRQVSKTGAVGRTVKFGKDRGKEIQPKGPWVDWFGEMARKTVMRRHAKVLPMSGDVFRDVEGEEIELAARSGAAILDAVEPDAPKALPSKEDLGDYLGDGIPDFDDGDDQQIDPDTGEVQTDSRGMTDVDEETARQLDAGEPGAEDGGEQTVAASDVSPAEAFLEKTRSGIAAAKNAKNLTAVETEWLKNAAAYDDEIVAGIDADLAARRKALADGGKG